MYSINDLVWGITWHKSTGVVCVVVLVSVAAAQSFSTKKVHCVVREVMHVHTLSISRM